MRAIVIDKPGGPEVLQLREVATPVPARGVIRTCRITAAAARAVARYERCPAGFRASAAPPVASPSPESAGWLDSAVVAADVDSIARGRGP